MALKRFILSVLVLLLIFAAFPLNIIAEGENSAEDNKTSADPGLSCGYVTAAYCVEYEEFLWETRLDETVAPCVAAKLVTGMVVIDILKERGLATSDVNVVVTKEAVDSVGEVVDVRSPIMGFKKDNIFVCTDLLQALFVASANDAATSLASYFGKEYLGGDISTFVDRMNEKVASLGLNATHFTHPAGLADPDQKSTGRDVAKIAAAFYKYDELVKLADVEEFRFNGKSMVKSKNYLKCNYYVSGFLNKNAIGIISGQETVKGNYCLISATQKEGVAYVFVVMCAPSLVVETDSEGKKTYSFADQNKNAYSEMNKLINWTRDSFKICDISDTTKNIGELKVENGLTDHVMVVPRENVSKLIRFVDGVEPEVRIEYDADTVYTTESNGNTFDTVKAPIRNGQKVGTAHYYYNGEHIASVDVIARDKVDSSLPKTLFDKIKEFLTGSFMKKLLLIIGGIIVLYVIFELTMTVIRVVKKFKKGSKNTKKDKKEKQRSKKTDTHDDKTDTREIK